MVFNHYSWVDVVTYLWHEKGLAVHLLKAYDEDIVNVLAKEKMEAIGETGVDYLEWKADVVTHLYCEKGLRGALLDAYKGEIEEALQTKVLSPIL